MLGMALPEELAEMARQTALEIASRDIDPQPCGRTAGGTKRLRSSRGDDAQGDPRAAAGADVPLTIWPGDPAETSAHQAPGHNVLVFNVPRLSDAQINAWLQERGCWPSAIMVVPGHKLRLTFSRAEHARSSVSALHGCYMQIGLPLVHVKWWEPADFEQATRCQEPRMPSEASARLVSGLSVVVLNAPRLPNAQIKWWLRAKSCPKPVDVALPPGRELLLTFTRAEHAAYAKRALSGCRLQRDFPLTRVRWWAPADSRAATAPQRLARPGNAA